MPSNIQIMPKVFILGCINALLAYRDIDEGRRPETYPYILGRALIQPRINTKGIICFLFHLISLSIDILATTD